MKKFTAWLKNWWAQYGRTVYVVMLLAFLFFYAKHQAKESMLEGFQLGIQHQKEIQRLALRQIQLDLQKKREP